MQVHFRDRIVGEFRIDLVVADRVVVEAKAVSQLVPAHEVQLVKLLSVSRQCSPKY